MLGCYRPEKMGGVRSMSRMPAVGAQQRSRPWRSRRRVARLAWHAAMSARSCKRSMASLRTATSRIAFAWSISAWIEVARAAHQPATIRRPPREDLLDRTHRVLSHPPTDAAVNAYEEPEVRRVLLVDSPAALAWEAHCATSRSNTDSAHRNAAPGSDRRRTTRAATAPAARSLTC